MKQMILRLTIALLTFAVGVTCAVSYRVITFHHVQVMHAREAILRDDLFQMRKLIDQYAADKGALPRSLDDLVRAGYLRGIPVDPMTGQKDWIVVLDDDPNAPSTVQVVVDVHSASCQSSSEGTAYNEW